MSYDKKSSSSRVCNSIKEQKEEQVRLLFFPPPLPLPKKQEHMSAGCVCSSRGKIFFLAKAPKWQLHHWKVVCPPQFSENIMRSRRSRTKGGVGGGSGGGAGMSDGQLWHAGVLRQLLTVSASHHFWHNTNTAGIILHYTGGHGSL